MHISAMNVRIMIQKSGIEKDEIGNEIAGWSDYYSCFATTSTKGGDEAEDAAAVVPSLKVCFTVRYSSETAKITSDGYRILLKDRIYNILYIDDMAFKHKSLKIYAELERRADEYEMHD